MKFAEFRRAMESNRSQADKDAMCLKDPSIVRERLLNMYGRFDADDRIMANQVLSEWVLSEDEALRFDAVGLIKDLKIGSATPSLRKLAERLGRERSPGAPFELEKVQRIIAALSRP